MSDYDVLREMLERSPIPGKDSSASGNYVDGEWVETTIDFDNKTIPRQHGDREIIVWRGYVHFYTVISFDPEGRLIDIEAYE